MAQEQGQQPPPPQQDWLKLSSFDAASFFAAQHQEAALRGQQLRAAAEALLPASSSEEESSSEAETQDGRRELQGSDQQQQRDARDPGRHRRREKGEEDGERRQKRKKEQKRKRKRRGRSRSQEPGGKRRREGGEAQGLPNDWQQAVEMERRKGPQARASQVRGWAGREVLKEPYYYDTRGDPANIAFGGLYRGDIPLYRRHDPSIFAVRMGARPRRGPAGARGVLPREGDSQRPEARYFSPAAARRERSGRLRRWRRPPRPSASAGLRLGAVPPGSFLPLDPTKDSQQQQQQPEQPEGQPATFYQVFVPPAQREAQQQGQQQQPDEGGAGAAGAVDHQAAPPQLLQSETQDEYILRRTREFNAATRVRPQGLQLWLDYAAFQDEVARSGPLRRGAQRAAAEKKVAILERALGSHPGSDQLLLPLLEAAQLLCDDEEMDRRWRRALARRSSLALWRAYLRRRAAQWSGFSAKDMPRLHCQAVAALALERKRAATAGASPAALAELESGIAQLALAGCQAALGAGATELGIAMIQVLLELNFFAPEGWPQDALEVMFEDFWSSGAALVGEEGGAGWGGWLSGEPQQRPKAAAARAGAQRAAGEDTREAREEKDGAAAAAPGGRVQQDLKESAAVQAGKGGGASGGGWGGWEEMAPAIRARFGHSLAFLDEELGKPAGDEEQQPKAMAGEAQQQQQQGQQEERAEHEGEAKGGEDGGSETENEEEEEEREEEEGEEEAEEEQGEEEPEEEDEEALLQRLGLQLDEALAAGGDQLAPAALSAWLATERRRDAAAWAPLRVGPSAAGGQGGSEGEEEEEEGVVAGDEGEAAQGVAGGGGVGQRRKVAWQEVRSLLVPLESAAAKQQLLLGALLLLGAPLSVPSSGSGGPPPAAADELWQAAAWLGLPGDSPSSSSSSRSTALPWTTEVLSRCDWHWLHQQQCSNRGSSAANGDSTAEPVGAGTALREQRWYQEHPSRQQMLMALLTALARGPGRQQPAVAAALLHVAAEVVWPLPEVGADDEEGRAAAALGQEPGPASQATQATRQPREQQQLVDWKAARGLAKELLAVQRDNLVLWQAYAELERQAGASKAVRKVYDACLVGAGAAALAAAPASAAPLVFEAVAFELGGANSANGEGVSLLHAVAAATESAAGGALRLLAWLGSRGAVALRAPTGASSALSQPETVAARKGYQDLLLSLLHQQPQEQQQQSHQQLVAASLQGGAPAVLGAGEVALVAAAAAFELLAGRLQRGGLTAGVKPALAIYDQVLTAMLQQQQRQEKEEQQAEAVPGGGPAVPAAPFPVASSAGPHLERLCVQWCSLAAEASRLSLAMVSPASARAVLMRGLDAFPASPPLLQLLVAFEVAGHTLAQLRRTLLGLLANHPSPAAWLALLATEVVTQAPSSALRSVLERAVSSAEGRGCPLLWRLYLRREAAAGRTEAVHRVFLRAIGACPGAKAIWTDGLALLNGVAPPKELTEFLGVMRDKELTLRTDAYEVVLEQLGAGLA